MSKTPKWGSIDEIDNRCRVGSEAWKRRHSKNIQHLSAYRRLHDLADHQDVRHLVDESVKAKVDAVQRLERGEDLE